MTGVQTCALPICISTSPIWFGRLLHTLLSQEVALTQHKPCCSEWGRSVQAWDPEALVMPGLRGETHLGVGPRWGLCSWGQWLAMCPGQVRRGAGRLQPDAVCPRAVLSGPCVRDALGVYGMGLTSCSLD